MNNENNLQAQEDELIKQLNIVKQGFIKNNEQLKYSIRKDVIAAQLKDLLESNSTFYELKYAIENLIDDLLKI